MTDIVQMKKYYPLKYKLQEIEDRINLEFNNNYFILKNNINYYDQKDKQGQRGLKGPKGEKGDPGRNTNVFRKIIY
tara:strand:+ start:777 stop:1004 length:228 start_codon:yes stop_codon:yes gene_type:complete